MRNHRMRGYGAWCMGWNEAQRTPYEPNNSGNGCLIVFFVILALTFFKVAIETGTPLGFLIGIALLAGLFRR